LFNRRSEAIEGFEAENFFQKSNYSSARPSSQTKQRRWLGALAISGKRIRVGIVWLAVLGFKISSLSRSPVMLLMNWQICFFVMDFDALYLNILENPSLERTLLFSPRTPGTTPFMRYNMSASIWRKELQF
jgi:hypothetical protein